MDRDNLKIIRNIYLQKFYKMSILIYYIEKNKHTDRSEKSQQPAYR